MPRIYQHKTTDYQPIPVSLNPGKYLLECWGAEGGTGITDSEYSYHGGRGAYASGILDLKSRTTFYLYIGTQGENGTYELNTIAPGGWNGGGNGGKDTAINIFSPGAGGGATDIRLVRAPDNQEAEDEDSLDSRIIVAAGGSGSVRNSYGAPGGDLTGYKLSNTESYSASDTNQEDGNAKGQGENGDVHVAVPSSGAGGGYFGGKAAEGTDNNHFTAVSSSGSSYVSGFLGCKTLTNTLGSVFDYTLQYPRIINGFSNFPSVDYETTKTYETGHSGNGAVKITRLDVYTSCAYRKSNILLYVSIFIVNTST